MELLKEIKQRPKCASHTAHYFVPKNLFCALLNISHKLKDCSFKYQLLLFTWHNLTATEVTITLRVNELPNILYSVLKAWKKVIWIEPFYKWWKSNVVEKQSLTNSFEINWTYQQPLNRLNNDKVLTEALVLPTSSDKILKTCIVAGICTYVSTWIHTILQAAVQCHAHTHCVTSIMQHCIMKMI